MQGRLVHSYTTELEKHIELGSENFYKLLHKGDPKADLLLASVASSTLGMCAQGSPAVLMEISKQGHTCHKSCFPRSKNICGSCLLERQRPLLVLPVLAGCTLHLQLPVCPGECIPLTGNTLLNLLSTKLESKIITANFPLGPPLQTTKDSEDTLKQLISPGKCHTLKSNCLSFNWGTAWGEWEKWSIWLDWNRVLGPGPARHRQPVGYFCTKRVYAVALCLETKDNVVQRKCRRSPQLFFAAWIRK